MNFGQVEVVTLAGRLDCPRRDSNISGSGDKRSIDWFEGDEHGGGAGEDASFSPLLIDGPFWQPMDALHERKMSLESPCTGSLGIISMVNYNILPSIFYAVI
jgi:hypothetical protein